VLLGRALRGRPDLPVTTKVIGPGTRPLGDLTVRGVLDEIDGSRRRLGREVIDLLLVHRVDDGTPIAVVLTAFAEAVASGAVRAVGTSSMAPDLLLEALRVAHGLGLALSVEQCHYSRLDRTAAAGFFPVARRAGLRTARYGVLEEGLLARGSAAARPRANVGIHPWPEAAARSLAQRTEVAERLERLAAEAGRSLLELAVAFAAGTVADAAGPPTLVVGARCPEQIAPVVDATAALVDAELLARVD
jgi:aryl-alcohol dehydrogenase-like predicted oxidoreductase